MKSIVKILIIGVSIITPLAGFAQEKRDTISGFNAMDYLLQNRFRNTGYPFKNKSILDHTYMQVGVGASYIMPVENIRYGMIKNVHFVDCVNEPEGEAAKSRFTTKYCCE